MSLSTSFVLQNIINTQGGFRPTGVGNSKPADNPFKGNTTAKYVPTSALTADADSLYAVPTNGNRTLAFG